MDAAFVWERNTTVEHTSSKATSIGATMDARLITGTLRVSVLGKDFLRILTAP